MINKDEEFYRALYESNHVIMLLIDPITGFIIDSNTAASNFYGWSKEQLSNMRIWDLNTMPVDEVKQEMRRASSQIKNHFSFLHRISTGQIRQVEVISGPINIDGKSLLYSIIQDVTECKVAEKEAKRHLEFERTILFLAQNFINMPLDQLDGAIHAALALVVDYCGARRATFWKYDWKQQISTKLYEYDNEPSIGIQLKEVKLDVFSELIEHLRHGEAYYITYDEHEKYRQYFLDTGIRSSYILPLRFDGALYGTFTISLQKQSKQWSDNETNTVRIFSEMLTSVLQRKESTQALLDTMESQRLVLDSVSDGIAMVNRDGELLNVNRIFAKRFKETKDAAIGRNLMEFLPKDRYGDLYEKRIQLIRDTLDTCKPVISEDSRDGIYFENRFYPVIKDGKAVAVAFFSTNISDRKKAEDEAIRNAELRIREETLQKKEKELLEILDGSTEGTYIVDYRNETLLFSDQWAKKLGVEMLTPEQLFEKAKESMLDYDQAESTPERINASKAKELKVKGEIPFEDRDGNIIWVLRQGKLIFDEEGLPAKGCGTFIDITKQKITEYERKRVDEALGASISLLSTIIEGTTEVIFLQDRQCRMLIANSATAQAIGLPLAEILGKTNLENFKDAEKAKVLMENDNRIMDSDTAEVLEELVPASNGLRTYLSTKVPWHDPDGNVIGIICVARDITDRKAMEEELIRTANELIRKNKLITDFFTNISHEFKTPLSVIFLQFELMELCIGDEKKLRKLISIAKQNSFRLARLVSNILDITKIDSGFMKVNIANVNIVLLLKDICESVETYVKAKSIDLKYISSLKNEILPTDKDKIERILLNLISNAIKHTEKCGLITISIKKRRSGGVIITVEDNGEGIPEEKHKIIFDRFEQVDTAFNRKNEGSGIGLTLVKALVEMLNGTIRVQSEIHKGSKFIIELPFLSVDSEANSIEMQGYDLGEKAEMELSDLYL